MTRRQPIGHPANSTKYKKARAAFMRKQGRWGWCSICGGLVDMNLKGRTTADGPTIDHVVATTAGGAFFDQSNWALAHRRCNSAKGRGEAIEPGFKSGYPTPGDPRYCWIKGMDGWMHINPVHGEPDHWNCQWPGCLHGVRT